MSSISGVGGGSSIDLAKLRQDLFKQNDTNGNNKISKDEFVSSRPQGVSESQASDLFLKIDSKGTGEISQKELESGLEKNKPTGNLSSLKGGNLSSDSLSTLLQAISNDNSSTNSTKKSSNTNNNSSDIFNQIDSDQDGKVTKNEFVEGRPDFLSESDAANLFSQIDKEGTGSVTQEQFSANKPQPPFGGGLGLGNSLSQDSSSDLVDKLLSAISSYSKNAYSGFSTNSPDPSGLFSS
jgi:Ca2+-binding EF-hand superfamily protein